MLSAVDSLVPVTSSVSLCVDAGNVTVNCLLVVTVSSLIAYVVKVTVNLLK